MAILESFFTNIADSIRTASRTTAKIPAQNFSSEILKLTNTKDANASVKDLAIGKTAYVNGAKISGSAYVYSGNTASAGMYAVVKDVTNLFNYSFSHCNLTGVDFRNCNTAMAYRVFYNCTNLREVLNFPSTVTNVYQGFFNCQNLYTINIPNAVYASQVFDNCRNLKSASIGNSAIDLSYAFRNCTNLTYVDCIPSTVTNTYGAFNNITVKYDIGTLCVNNLNTTYSSWKTYLNCVDNYVNSTGYTAFQGATGLTRVNNVTNVSYGYQMFQQCYTNLTYVNLYNSLNTLTNGQHMFYRTNALNNGLIGFDDSSKYDFDVLNNVSYMFSSSTPTISGVSRRISSKASGSIVATYTFSGSNNFSNIKFNFPNATSIIMDYALQTSNIVSNVYINAPSATSMSFSYTFANSGVSNIYLNISNISPTMSYMFRYKNTSTRTNVYIKNGSTINTLFYNSGTMNSSIFGSSYKWTIDSANTCYYNTTYNIYIYYNLTSLPSDL